MVKRSNPMSKEAAAGVQESGEELLHIQGQERQLVQGKEKWLCFAGAV